MNFAEGSRQERNRVGRGQGSGNVKLLSAYAQSPRSGGGSARRRWTNSIVPQAVSNVDSTTSTKRITAVKSLKLSTASKPPLSLVEAGVAKRIA